MSAVPILAFHSVERGPAPLCIDPDTFGEQVDALVARGVRDITLREVINHLADGTPIPDRRVAFTFDDAYAGVADHALPILHAAGFRATVFAVSGRLGATNDWDPPSRGGGLRIMGPTELADLHGQGWEIGSHTRHHSSLPALDDAGVLAEMQGADADLEDLLGAPVSWLAYPYGHHDARVRRLAAQRYDGAVATGAAMVSSGSDRYSLPRVEAWYLRRPITLTHLHDRRGAAYLAARRAIRGLRAGGRRG